MKKKFILFSVLAMVCAGLIFAGCKKDNDKDDPNPSETSDLTPEEDDVAKIEAALAGNYFYSSSVQNLGMGGFGDLEMFFSKEGKKVTLSSRNETPWTISWQVNKDREITFKASSADPNKLYGTLQGEINKSGSTVSIWGKDANGTSYEIELKKASGSLSSRILNEISGRGFTAKGAWNNQDGSDMTLNVISGQSGQAYVMHAGECRYNVTLKLNDIFKQNNPDGWLWNASIEATNANEKLSGSGVYNSFKNYTNEEWYGKVLKAHISEDGQTIVVLFDNEGIGKKGVVEFKR
jgi:hypothetical protein